MQSDAGKIQFANGNVQCDPDAIHRISAVSEAARSGMLIAHVSSAGARCREQDVRQRVLQSDPERDGAGRSGAMPAGFLVSCLRFWMGSLLDTSQVKLLLLDSDGQSQVFPWRVAHAPSPAEWGVTAACGDFVDTHHLVVSSWACTACTALASAGSEVSADMP
jgi:hypothetical protein